MFFPGIRIYNNVNRSVMNLFFLLGWLWLSLLSDNTIFEDVWMSVTLCYTTAVTKRGEISVWLSRHEILRYPANCSAWRLFLLYRQFQLFPNGETKQRRSIDYNMLVQLGMKSSGSEPKGNIFLLFSSSHKRFSTENFCLPNNTEKFRELQKFCFNTQQTLNNKQVNKQKIDKQQTKHMSSFCF